MNNNLHETGETHTQKSEWKFLTLSYVHIHIQCMSYSHTRSIPNFITNRPVSIGFVHKRLYICTDTSDWKHTHTRTNFHTKLIISCQYGF